MNLPNKLIKKKRKSPVFNINPSKEIIEEIVTRFKKGETISSLSKEYKISIERIYAYSLESYRKASKSEVEIVNPEDVMLANC
jgi:Mor family transcriptional regulator